MGRIAPLIETASLPFASGLDLPHSFSSGTKPLASLLNHPRIRYHTIAAVPKLPAGLPKLAFLAYAPLKVLFQIIQLLWTLLFSISRPSYMLVQVSYLWTIWRHDCLYVMEKEWLSPSTYSICVRLAPESPRHSHTHCGLAGLLPSEYKTHCGLA